MRLADTISNAVAARVALAATLIGFGGAVAANPGNHGRPEMHRLLGGSVFTMTNAASGNEVIAFERAPDGALAQAGAWSAGGAGTGAGLGNQGGLAMTSNHRWLLGVNAGSNQVFVFAVRPNGLDLTDVEGSGGTMPISVATTDNLVYVLNAAAPANITGFRISPFGRLSPIAGSTQPLSTANPGPAQVGFSSDGQTLVVTEKATSAIDTFTVDDAGRAQNPQVFPSVGSTPFGFAFDSSNHLFVSEAFPSVPNGSATSAYGVEADGSLNVITPSAPTMNSSACWAVTTPNDRYLYIADAASNVITGYAIALDGSISLLNADGVAANTGAATKPLDMAITHNGRYLYVIEAASASIGAYEIGTDGSLTEIPGVSGLPATINGLVAR